MKHALPVDGVGRGSNSVGTNGLSLSRLPAEAGPDAEVYQSPKPRIAWRETSGIPRSSCGCGLLGARKEAGSGEGEVDPYADVPRAQGPAQRRERSGDGGVRT